MNLTYFQYKNEERISVDIETKDPDLPEKGPGVYRGEGYVVGVSMSNGDLSEYYPLRHPDTSAENFEKNHKYLKDQLSSNNNKVFANGMYDLDWLINFENIPVKGRYDDVQIAEPILDEYRKSYSLNSLSKSYLNEQKASDELKVYCEDQGWKITKKTSPITYLWKMPYDAVKHYASDDARLTYLIFKKQMVELKEQGLYEMYEMEMELFPLLLQMRKTGVRIDENKLFKTGMELADNVYELQEEFNTLAGFEINVNSSPDLVKLFNLLGLQIMYNDPTDKMMMTGKMRGNPTFSKQVLSRIDNETVKKILELRHTKTLLSLFIHPYPDLLIDGRLHCQFNQLRSDKFGTVSGRFSSSNPNLQQVSGKNEGDYISAKDNNLSGSVIRKLFIPEESCCWLKLDWSQIEYRLIAHFALGDGAETIRRRYNEDPNVDYHNEVGKMAGIDDRKTVKTLNFGGAYGMGIEKMASTYGWNLAEAEVVYKNYHKKVPFIKETSKRVALKAKRVGFIKTVLKRKARIPSSNKGYIMFNRLIQGSAADIMKKAMVDSFKAGVFDILYPHLTVHDEMDVSMPRTKEGTDAGKELKRIMENCVKLKVPIIADAEVGPSWGELKKWEV